MFLLLLVLLVILAAGGGFFVSPLLWLILVLALVWFLVGRPRGTL